MERQIVIPLSAGNDSRYIASALRHIGYDNVYVFHMVEKIISKYSLQEVLQRN